MSSQPSSVTPDQARAALAAGAVRIDHLAALCATGAMGRWAACQSATANYHSPHVVQAPTFWGGHMEVDIRETVSSEVFIHGIFEPELSSFFHDHLRPGQTFVDVGAHYGYFSLLAAHCVGAEGRVVSIEPCERTSWRLYRNTKDLPQVRIHKLAAWEKEETLTLHDYGPLYSAFNSIGERRIHESAPAVKGTPFEIRAVALDDFFEENGIAPDVIKIDAESAEIQVLRGLARTLRTRRPVITLEVGDYDHLLAKGGTSSAEVLRMIADHGYALLSPGVGSITTHEIHSARNYDYGNVVAVPGERTGEFIR